MCKRSSSLTECLHVIAALANQILACASQSVRLSLPFSPLKTGDVSGMRRADMAGSWLLCTTNAGVGVWNSSKSWFGGAGVFPAAVASDVVVMSRGYSACSRLSA